MKSLYIFCFFLVLSTTLSLRASGNNSSLSYNFSQVESDSLQVLEYLEDLDTLKSWVESLHPLPFERCTEEKWLDVIEKAKNDVKAHPTSWGMTLAVGDMLGTLKDSHTSIALGKWSEQLYDTLGVCPLSLTSINGVVYVKNDASDTFSTGAKIDSINGISAEELLELARRISPQEGNSWLSKTRIAELFIINVAVALAAEKEFLISSSRSSSRSDYGLKYGGINVHTELNGSEIYIFAKPKKKGRLRILRGRSKSDDVIQWIEDEDTKNTGEVRLKINSFAKGRGIKYYRRLERGFKKLEKTGAEALIIDLRGNTGGHAERMEEIFYYLSDQEILLPAVIIMKQSKESASEIRKVYKGIRKKIIDKWEFRVSEFAEIKRAALRQIGVVDTLINKPQSSDGKYLWDGATALLMDGISASASVSFASKFEELGRGPIFGESCMGPRTGTFGNPVTRKLPHSGLYVSISTAQYMLNEDLKFESQPIKPTRWMQTNLEELKADVDPTYSAIRDWMAAPEVGWIDSLKVRESKVLWEELETVFSRERSWGGEVREEVWYRVLLGDKCLVALENERRKVESQGTEELAILEDVKEIRSSMKDCKALRNATIRLKLPAELRNAFEELVAPNRPAVMHFGIHNRADCKVCKPK